MRKPLLSALVAAGVAAVSGCTVQGAVAGAIAAAPALFIGDAEEIKIGKQTRDQMLTEYPVYPNPVIRDYVTKIGEKLVGVSERKGLNYEWYVVDSKEINAFAAPGGFVFVTTGALKLMKNEAQLAGVLGHEIGHVAKYHSINGIRQALVAKGVVTGVLGQGSDQLTQLGANIAANLILKHGDRSQELESDALGAEYAYKLGYDARELGGFLDALTKNTGATPAWLTWFSDHPGTNDRLDLLNKTFVARKFEFAKTTKGEEAYQTTVLTTLGVPIPSPSPSATPVPAATPVPVATPTPKPETTPSPNAEATPTPKPAS